MYTVKPIYALLFCLLFALVSSNHASAGAGSPRGIVLKQLKHNGTKNSDRIALVFGNSQYLSLSPLKNPSNDATAVAKSLSRLNFTVDLRINNSHQQMISALAQFEQKLSNPNTVALFYYAGHGVQIDGSNFLLPVDAKALKSSDVQFEALNLAKVLNVMAYRKGNLNIVILDACRNNPFVANFRALKRGLAQLSAPTGTLLAYATAPGAVAADGEGKNGIYTNELLKHIETPNLSIEKLFKNVRKAVIDKTNWQQVPWESSSLLGDFYFAGKTTLPTKRSAAPPQVTDCNSKQIDQRPVECLFGESI